MSVGNGRVDWPEVLAEAASIVVSYDTGVTLRQLFYRLVAAERLPNTAGAYKALSSRTAEARRSGRFPPLIDRTRSIHRATTFDSPLDALETIVDAYRRDRTDGQDVSLYLGVEKAGIVEQLRAWFGDLGVPILALGGYSSQSYVDHVRGDVERQDRSAVLLYAGDHDPSGEDIDRDFLKRAGCFDHVHRVALTVTQVEEHALPPQPGKATDARAGAFIARHGRLVQVELDALPPEVLRRLYAEAIEAWWDTSTFEGVVAREARERSMLEQLAEAAA
jgi:hypothetical protein